MMHYITAVLALVAQGSAGQPPAADELDQAQAAPSVAGDALGQAQAAAARGDWPEALSRYLRVLAAQPDDVAALAGAGQAALAVGDVNAATGFFARAEGRDPRNGPVKAGLGRALLKGGDARGALRFFRDAVELGVSPAAIAADRGLAYDLRGDPKRAQADYQLALRDRPSDELTRRLAVSQAIGGDRVAALATLDPQLRRQDVAAWRTRAFVRALTGDVAGANADANLILPPAQVQALAPYFTRLAALKPGEKAAAVDLGRFPSPAAPRQAIARAAPPAPPRLALDQTVTSTPAPVPPSAPPAAAVAAPVMVAAADPPVPSAAERRAEQARVRAERQAAQREAAKAEAARREKAEALAEAKVARANPARSWVQVAGGANKRDLGKAWDKLKKQWPAQLAGRSPWTLHYRFTNRLLIGPFPSADAAQDWVSARRKEGFATFRVDTDAGDPVERVKG